MEDHGDLDCLFSRRDVIYWRYTMLNLNRSNFSLGLVPTLEGVSWSLLSQAGVCISIFKFQETSRAATLGVFCYPLAATSSS